MIVLRPYQNTLKSDVKNAWEEGHKNVCMQLSTGGGKTAIIADLIQEHKGFSAVMAHRQELVSQISFMLARYQVPHDIIAPKKVKSAIARLQSLELGRSFIDPSAQATVASVQTLIRAKDLHDWAAKVTRWTVDEGHHLVQGNTWGRMVDLFKHSDCRGLGPTATPIRADGKGLGAHADGYFHKLVCGPSGRWLIENGYLVDYRVVCPDSDLRVLQDVAASGDWSSKALKEAAQKSRIVGDVVSSYLQYAAGKLGVTFATDVETAIRITQKFNDAGVRAATLTGETDDSVRRQILADFAARRIMQIVAVDIISEGFDLPAIEVLIMARPTASLSLYLQQFGRALRILEGKDKALIIDLVGNFLRHQGGPDRDREYTLDARERRGSSAPTNPFRVCTVCFEPYERFHLACPYCGSVPEPAGRGSPEEVDGDLCELSPEILAKIRGEANRGLMDLPSYHGFLLQSGIPTVALRARLKDHESKLGLRGTLIDSMDLWGGIQHERGLSDREIQKLFFLDFGVDVLSCKNMSAKDTADLKNKIDGAVNKHYIKSIESVQRK